MGAPIDAKVLKGCARRGVADTKELSEAIEDVISRYSTVGGVFVLDRWPRNGSGTNLTRVPIRKTQQLDLQEEIALPRSLTKGVLYH